MMRPKFSIHASLVAVICLGFSLGIVVQAQNNTSQATNKSGKLRSTTNAQRLAAAANAAAAGKVPAVKKAVVSASSNTKAAVQKKSRGLGKTMAMNALSTAMVMPGSMPDYFGPYPNYANSQLPPVITITDRICIGQYANLENHAQWR
jgi:hypothetical protein